MSEKYFELVSNNKKLVTAIKAVEKWRTAMTKSDNTAYRYDALKEVAAARDEMDSALESIKHLIGG